MFEILFIFGIFGWLLGQLWEFLSALPAFPTLLAGFLLVPLLAFSDFAALLHRFELNGIHENRQPVPPERFYWPMHRARLRRVLYWMPAVAIATWAAALKWPAGLSFDTISVMGWLTGATAIVASARTISVAVIYVRASQWFDIMAPWAIGFCRTTMYRMSENPDFLGPENVRRENKEKSMY